MLWTQASLRKGLDNGNSGLRKPRDRRGKGEEALGKRWSPNWRDKEITQMLGFRCPAI